MESTAAIQTKPKRYRAPKPRTPALRRGKACLNCRHLKIVAATVYNLFVETVFACPRTINAPTTSPPLAGNAIKNINKLTLLVVPLASTFLCQMNSRTLHQPQTFRVSTPALSPGALSSDSLSEVKYGDFELPTETVNQLVSSLIDNAQPFGFFLDMNCLRTVATPSIELLLLQAPSANSLLFAAALLGARLANHTHYEKILVRRASESILAEVCSWESSQCNTSMAAETIQAQLLLARYFLLSGQTLAARVQVSGAEAIALSLEMHEDQLRSAAWWAIVELQTILQGLSATICSFLDPELCSDRLEKIPAPPTTKEHNWEWADSDSGSVFGNQWPVSHLEGSTPLDLSPFPWLAA
ncbi:Zn(2)-C6 fungal-type domain-containing protein [Mycena indigotica]|uniref:Zn(2)-C6 fungal-type domain-containing protein n=1 Tax=Mycena indigotica TaxID=2126181 RepID=A0A8H6S664_9AGAR|nr:Zn(2)-C6 fungal-type domain-containing protein [Mycena indigotica]KAF7293063.1 Zn(2)-C6 fungal-type domain-containing protein [Mycena indigotica]